MIVIAFRIILAVALLAGGWYAQHTLEQHLLSAGPLEAVPLARPLAEFPRQLGAWESTDLPIDPRSQYADDHLKRMYVNAERRQTLSVWIVYSRVGEDRGHHPEVCMAVAGRPEDTTQRSTIEVPGHAAPVQQYRFGNPGDRQWVFYWHYTLWPANSDKLTDGQRLYQRLHSLPSSVTLEVFAPENSPEDGESAAEFVKLFDAAMQAHLGPTAVRGSQRKPVTVLQQEAEPKTKQP